MLRFCRITERNSLRNSRNENGCRPRLTAVLNDVDDDDDVVLFDDVELLAARSCDSQIVSSETVAAPAAVATEVFDCCFSLHAIGTILVLLDHGDTVILPLIHPSISSQSVVVAVVAVDDVDADRNGGNGAVVDLHLLFVSVAAVVCLRCSIRLNGSIIAYLDGLSSVGLLLALVSVLSHPMLTFGCLVEQLLLLVPPPPPPPLHVLVFGLNEKSNIEFCSFVVENSDELELALTGIISSKSLDLGRFDKFASTNGSICVFVDASDRFSAPVFRSIESITLKPMD